MGRRRPRTAMGRIRSPPGTAHTQGYNPLLQTTAVNSGSLHHSYSLHSGQDSPDVSEARTDSDPCTSSSICHSHIPKPLLPLPVLLGPRQGGRGGQSFSSIQPSVPQLESRGQTASAPRSRDGTGLSKASLHGKLVCAPERQGHPQSSRIKPGRAAGSDRTQTQHFGVSRSVSAGSASKERCKAPAHRSRQSARAAACYTAPAGASSAFCLLVLSSLSPLRP